MKPDYSRGGIDLYTGDCLETLRRLPDECVQCCVTSPPYWGLRDYGIAGQLGLEPRLADYVTRMVEVFREVRRVLRPDGVLWVNSGDSYCGSWGNYAPTGKGGQREKSTERFDRGAYENKEDWRPPTSTKQTGLKPKDLCGVPWRVAFALQADGWWLRQDVIWSKPNPMPESVTDRCTKSHEYIFLLTKAERYYYDAEAIKEPASYLQPNSPESIKSPYGQGFARRAKGNSKTFRGGGSYTESRSFDNSVLVLRESHGNEPNETGTRNKRSVWSIATKSFPEAHFATFPPEIPEICMKAGSRPDDVILDPFNGAGTTGMVAARLGRRYIGIELNREYVNLSIKRINKELDKQSLFELENVSC